jgi:hypothetical protein
MGGGIVDFHAASISRESGSVNRISRIIEVQN